MECSLSMKSKKLKLIQEKTKDICQFLETYLTLANSHTTDFYVNNLWEKQIHPTIQKQLLALSDKQLAELPGWGPQLAMSPGTETGNISQNLEICGSNYSELHSAICETDNDSSTQRTFDKATATSQKHTSLIEFVKEAHQMSLPNLGVLTPLTHLLNSKQDVVISQFMSSKKCHEVEIMSDVCRSVCNKRFINQVVDAGCGRGYLSSYLSLKYNLPVIGIDSSSVNTHSATERTKKLNKQWSGLVTKAELLKQGIEVKRGKQKSKQKTYEKDQPVESLVYPKQEDSEDKTLTLNKVALNEPLKIFNTNKDSFGAEKVPCCLQERNSTFVPLTMFITPQTDLSEIVRNHSHGGAISPRVLLTGLHTCGSLASTLLKLFIQNPFAEALCNVGCCYHQLEEKFVTSPYHSSNGSIIPDEFGFPMSVFLRQQKFHLGRNARMLASQAIERVAMSKQSMSHSLHWRAVLQAILKDIGCDSNMLRVGKIAKKCTTFTQYVRKAFKKLDINHELLDEDIEVYEQTYGEKQCRMGAFLQLRTVLAPCIESLILLDRVSFLLEQNDIEEVHLTQLFDPVTSPRCFSIIAFKASKD